jgi:preprotein translocase subunit SecA
MYTGTVNLLRKYFGDFIIACYQDAVDNSGYDNAYIQEIEVIHFISLFF